MIENETLLREKIRAVKGLEHEPFSIELIKTGGNNQALKLRIDQDIFFVKHYFSDKKASRNRGLHEHLFSSYLWSQRVRCIPEPILYSEELDIAFFSFLDGSHISSVPDDAHIEQALAFFRDINLFRNSEGAGRLPVAAEGCFSIASHLETVRKRMERLLGLQCSLEIDIEARDFVHDQLHPTWKELSGFLSSSQGDIGSEIPNDLRCLSPSDFGFHNAIELEGRLYFLDFEYAGWDDPAKTMCDFFCQPKHPVPEKYLERVLDAISDGLSIDRTYLKNRFQLLLPVYAVKWCTIFLNDFLLDGDSRRVFAGDADSTTRKRIQLQKAKDFFSMFHFRR